MGTGNLNYHKYRLQNKSFNLPVLLEINQLSHKSMSEVKKKKCNPLYYLILDDLSSNRTMEEAIKTLAYSPHKLK